jgi:D-sedoheptulose 7-phosphate isomerase
MDVDLMARSELGSDLESHLAAVRDTVEASSDTVDAIVGEIARCFRNGSKLLACGNGGSAADAQHFVAEFVNRMRTDREPWPAIALTTDSSVLTSIANDRAFVDVFARQVQALGAPGDVLVAFSTSGRSENVLAALGVARQREVRTIGFTGESGRELMAPLCDLLIVAASEDTARIQECHGFLCHHIAAAVEAALIAASPGSGLAE